MTANAPEGSSALKRPRSVMIPNKGPREHRNHADNYWTLRNRLIVISILISGITIIVSAASILVAVIALSSSLSNQRHLKGIDLLQSFQKRYDELAYDMRPKIKPDEPDRAHVFYMRFWNLNFEEYQYCKADLIDRTIYSTWMGSRKLEWDINDPVGGIRYQDSWTSARDVMIQHDYGGHHDYKEFVDFMDGVFQGTRHNCVE
jgi:hypothetical protein